MSDPKPKTPQSPKSPSKSQPKTQSQPQSGTSPKAQKTIKTTQLHFGFLTEARVEQAAHLYTQTFLYRNSMWKQMGANYDEVFSVNRGRMISCCKAGWSCIMIDTATNQLVSVVPSLDLIDYIDTKMMPNDSPFLKTLGKYATELEKDYFESLRPTLKRGQIAYNYGGAVKPQYINGGISKRFWSIGAVYFKTAGYKQIYSRSTSRITTKLLLLIGGKIVKTVKITEPGVQGEYMQLIRIELDKLTYDTLTHFYEDLTEDDQDEDGGKGKK